MHILVVSLPGSHARKSEISAHLTQLGLDFEIFDAIDGRDGVPAQFESQVDRGALATFWRELSDGEISCALSHALACKHIAENIRGPAIILEDDAILSADFARLATSGLLEKSERDLVLLYHHNTRAAKWPRPALFAPYHLRIPVKPPWGAVAYFVTCQTAETIAKRSLPIAGVSDWGFDILELRTGCVVPRIVEHPEFDIEQTTMKERGENDAIPAYRRRTMWNKAKDPKYRQYFYRKIRSEWIYRP